MQIYHSAMDGGQVDEVNVVQHNDDQGDDPEYTIIYSHQGDVKTQYNIRCGCQGDDADIVTCGYKEYDTNVV